jgi:hypothetical protein
LIICVLASSCRRDGEAGAGVQVSNGISSCVSGMPNEYISTVALVRTSSPTTAFCSGVIVGNQRIATAKHCLEGEDPRSIAVVFHSDLHSANESHRKTGIGMELSPNLDAALLFIGGIPSGSSYRSASLVGNVDIRSGAKLRFLGYGATNVAEVYTGETSRYVRCGEWKLSRFVNSYGPGSNQTEYRYGFEFGNFVDYVNGTNEGIQEGKTASICAGDSGGPIFVERDGGFKLLGLSSVTHTVCEVISFSTGADLRLANSFLLRTPIQDLRERTAPRAPLRSESAPPQHSPPSTGNSGPMQASPVEPNGSVERRRKIPNEQSRPEGTTRR